MTVFHLPYENIEYGFYVDDPDGNECEVIGPK